MNPLNMIVKYESYRLLHTYVSTKYEFLTLLCNYTKPMIVEVSSSLDE